MRKEVDQLPWELFVDKFKIFIKMVYVRYKPFLWKFVPSEPAEEAFGVSLLYIVSLIKFMTIFEVD